MLRQFYSITALALLGLVSTGQAKADPIVKLPPGGIYSSAFMRVFGLSQPPYGFVRFCETNAVECSQDGREEARLDALPERLSELDAINRTVNRAIKPLTDMEVYGVTEYWTLPTSAGDCEDYALLKRKMLMQRGWPASSLLMTVVRDERGEGHAVLTARMAQGDYVLDNKVDGVKLWHQTPYQFVMRQSYLNPKVWVALESGDQTKPASIAGVDQPK
ncbi:MAG: transglutaminase-like cysteine peptidase [Hyphomicrobiaceae bacterium]|nr:transglutaminase-like cysteine peptidase [Hyphomicrobiaceae bacterium]